VIRALILAGAAVGALGMVWKGAIQPIGRTCRSITAGVRTLAESHDRLVNVERKADEMLASARRSEANVKEVLSLAFKQATSVDSRVELVEFTAARHGEQLAQLTRLIEEHQASHADLAALLAQHGIELRRRTDEPTPAV
jgi:hypothetical protein